MAESKNFDIVGVFLSDYGLTGPNIALQIFSYLDFSSLQNGLLVCENWTQFLTKDRTLWLQMLGKTQPVLQYLSNELSNGDEDECKVWQEYFDSLKMKEDIKFDKISRLFTKIMSMFAIIQEWGDENGYGYYRGVSFNSYYIPENLKDGYFSQILTAEIRVQYGPFFQWINERLSGIEYSRAKKEDLEYDDITTSDSDDETYQIQQIQVYDAAIRKTQSKLLKRIKREIVNSAM